MIIKHVPIKLSVHCRIVKSSEAGRVIGREKERKKKKGNGTFKEDRLGEKKGRVENGLFVK